MQIFIILGTRPEIIKMSPIIRECQKRHLNFSILHTNQHYSQNLDKIFFKELNLPQPRYNLNVGSGTHAEQTAKILLGIEKILIKEKPDIVLVEGDTNTVLAGALAAAKLHIKIGHIEAGLRSYDREMPEEINRILTDHCSDLLFAPTKKAKEILLQEGISSKKIFVIGNTIVDAVFQNIKLAEQKSEILKKLHLQKEEYFLLTAHRQENVDNRERLKGILKGVELISQKFSLPVIYSIHPRTRKMLKKFKLSVSTNINLIEPLGYLDFLKLQKNAKLILTDSGGIQEEACIMKVPCVTLRDNTERPETLLVKSNILAGTNPQKIMKSAKKMLNLKKQWKNPFGNGTAAEKILEVIKS
ncbi:MAG: UDP-N-acetylglucosamine 2-epimerase (non-hydrolyzing) [Candidatus Pacebacteria bacterium]|nr:UDP-N-acetylglucosamine 2-epimerase (non-hydrolyzing) [Candidatus Paceibacterota bacterium]